MKYNLFFVYLCMEIKYGITGNYYVYSDNKDDLKAICNMIDKAESSIYFNKKYSVYSIRIKNKYHKKLIKTFLK